MQRWSFFHQQKLIFDPNWTISSHFLQKIHHLGPQTWLTGNLTLTIPWLWCRHPFLHSDLHRCLQHLSNNHCGLVKKPGWGRWTSTPRDADTSKGSRSSRNQRKDILIIITMMSTFYYLEYFGSTRSSETDSSCPTVLGKRLKSVLKTVLSKTKKQYLVEHVSKI